MRPLRAALLSAILLVPGLAHGQNEQLHTASKEELGCLKVLTHQENSWNHGDLVGFTDAYKDSPDTLFLAGTVTRGLPALLANYRHEYPSRASMGVLGFTEVEVHPLDENFAVVIGKYHLERGRKEGGNAEGLFSVVMEKTDKGWKIVVDHTS